MIFDAVIVRTTEGMGILSPEESFNVFVPKATSWRNVDLEKNSIKSQITIGFRAWKQDKKSHFIFLVKGLVNVVSQKVVF